MSSCSPSVYLSCPCAINFAAYSSRSPTEPRLATLSSY